MTNIRMNDRVKDWTKNHVNLSAARPRFGSTKLACFVFLFCIATALSAPAQTLTTLYDFCPKSGCTDGWAPVGLLQGTNGDLYGTTWFGGTSTACGTDGCGTLFTITTGGTLTTLHSFDGRDGAVPGGAVQATNGNFYGTTNDGGTSTACGSDGCGTVFKITAAGKLSTLHDFDFTDGSRPNGVVQGTDGNFYGTAWTGGANSCVVSGTNKGCGTFFKITAAGKLTTLHSFDSAEGAGPLGPLVQATNGNFYGTTRTPPGGEGGGYGYGTVFEITPSGTLTTLHSFDGTDGAYPYAGLVQATDGNLYGTTANGGANNLTGCDGGCGTIFKITPAGAFTSLYSFCSQKDCADGGGPFSLVQATDGKFYGATSGGGNISDCGGLGCGTVFSFAVNTAGTGGTLTTLHSFDDTDGWVPIYLVQATNGTLYGTANGGGNNNCPANSTTGATGCGTLWSLSVGLGAFVETKPTSGKVAAKVTILGTNLTGATAVTFNGTKATFTVVSSSEITTKVPKGATTGPVKVTTPSGTLTSNVNFVVP
jgi:uncharacterized repeat protein (TIGR03803 family)